MSWLSPFLWQSATRQRASATPDRYGNTRLDWDDPEVLDIVAYIEVRRSNERTIGEQQLVQEAVGFAETGTDIVATDRIVVDGVTWDVAGVIPRAFLGVAHLELELRRETGSSTAGGS